MEISTKSIFRINVDTIDISELLLRIELLLQKKNCVNISHGCVCWDHIRIAKKHKTRQLANNVSEDLTYVSLAHSL